MPPKWRGRFVKTGEVKRRKLSSPRITERNRASAETIENVPTNDDDREQPVTVNMVNKEHEEQEAGVPEAILTTDNILESPTQPWRHGCRLIELESCTDCGQPLQLHRVVHEKRYRLESLLYIECS